jgi:hypothetical protein
VARERERVMRRFLKRLKWRLLDGSRRQDCPASGIGVCPMEVPCMKGQPCCLKDSIATPVRTNPHDRYTPPCPHGFIDWDDCPRLLSLGENDDQ